MDASALPPVGRWKAIDNLRRALLAPLTLVTLALCWLLPLPAALVGMLLAIATIAIPAFLPIVFAILPRRPDIHVRSHIAGLAGELRLAAAQTLLSLTFLADQAWRAADAAIRTLRRLS